MTYLSITFPEGLKRQLDEEVKREGTKRSTFIQKAVRFYLELKRSKQANKSLREGYLATYKDARQMVNELVELDADILKHVD